MDNAAPAATSSASPLRLRFANAALGSALLLNVAFCAWLAMFLAPRADKGYHLLSPVLPGETARALQVAGFIQTQALYLFPALAALALLAALIDRKIKGFLAFYAAVLLCASTLSAALIVHGLITPLGGILRAG